MHVLNYKKERSTSSKGESPTAWVQKDANERARGWIKWYEKKKNNNVGEDRVIWDVEEAKIHIGPWIVLTAVGWGPDLSHSRDGKTYTQWLRDWQRLVVVVSLISSYVTGWWETLSVCVVLLFSWLTVGALTIHNSRSNSCGCIREHPQFFTSAIFFFFHFFFPTLFYSTALVLFSNSWMFWYSDLIYRMILLPNNVDHSFAFLCRYKVNYYFNRL